MPDMRPWLTVKQAAELMGVSQETILIWLNWGRLQGIDVSRDPGKGKPRWRITHEAIEAFKEARAHGTIQAPPKPARSKNLPKPRDFF